MLGHTISYNNSKLDHTPVLNFTGGVIATKTDNTSTYIMLEEGLSETGTLYWSGNVEDEDFKNKFISMYNNRKSMPFILITNIDNKEVHYLIDSTYPDITDDLSISISPESNNTTGIVQNNLVSLVNEKQDINITFEVDSESQIPSIKTIELKSHNDPVLSEKIPTQKYVDDAVGSGLKMYIGRYTLTPNTECVVTHNLNTQMVVLNTYTTTGESSIVLDHKILTNNTLKLTPNLLGENESLSIVVIVIGQPGCSETFEIEQE